MNKKQKSNWKNKLCNFSGAFGYLFCLFEWLWVVLVYFVFIQKISDFLISQNPPVKEQVIEHVVYTGTTISTFNPFVSLISLAIVIFILGLCVYVIIKAPSTFTKTSKDIVLKSANTVAPLVIKASHKKETKKTLIKVTSQLIIVIKVIILTLPVILTLLSALLSKQQIDFNISIVVITTLSLLSAVFFVSQYLLARHFKIKISELY